MTDHAFSTRLIADCRETSPTCVGIDPLPGHAPSLPFFDAADTYGWLMELGHRVIDACVGVVAAVKPQSAHYEVWGLDGIRALHDTVAYGRERGIVVVLDAKRGDIGSTAQSYATAYLSSTGAAPADALTINPYLGRDALAPFVDTAIANAAGVFTLVKTSNPGSVDLQDIVVDGAPIWTRVGGWVEAFNAGHLDADGFGPVGAVVGGTHPDVFAAARAAMPSAVFLVPGFGAQGGDVSHVAPMFRDGVGALLSSSRAITFRSDATDAAGYGRDVRRLATEFAEAARAAAG